ncbi:(E2-independent) E3 ubiquitin-conjugating enzyme FATS isoform X1 [Hemitrygon akajei]|uniref:(E2-independent) E3 ubiquitin-conjugating enzyme FATS isoform X1 n=1 Tax=Hemitrygon akajei TaxID=2704970 RepID=UPI003BF9558B
MELSIECVPTSYKSEEYKSSYWDFMMSQVKILPSRPFMANISLENISLQAQKTQKGVTGDFRKRAASPASQRVSMPELSSDYITYTGSPNNQNVNDKLGYSEGLNQCYSGSTKYMSKLNYSDKPFATTAQRTQDSAVYRTTNAEIDFGARTEKVQIKDFCVQRKHYITPVTSDTVKCHQLPKRCFATYINNEKFDNNTPVWYCTENKKMKVAFPSVQNNKNRLRTRGEDQLTQGLSEEAKDNLEHCIFMTHPHSRAPTSEHATFSKGKENNPSSLISLIIRAEAKKDCDVLPDCFQDSEGKGSQESIKYPNTFLSNTRHATPLTVPEAEGIPESTVLCRKDKTLNKSRNGFSSITVTARRLVSPVNKPSKPSLSASLRKNNSTQHQRSMNVLKYFKSSEDIVCIHSLTDNINEFPCNGYTFTEESSQSQSMLFSTEDRVSSLKINIKHHDTMVPSNNEDKTNLSSQLVHPAVSFVHFIVAPLYFNSTYYFDKSLLVDLCSLTNDNGSALIQKSSLSLRLSCTSANSSADGGDGMFKLISFIGSTKQEASYIMFDKEIPDISSRTRDNSLQQPSAVQKVSKTTYQYDGHLCSSEKETLSSPKRSSYLFISLLNMNKGTNDFIMEQKHKPCRREVQCLFSDLIRESADTKFSNSHVDLRGKKKSALKQSQEKFALSMTAKFTGSSTENEGEDIESVSDTDTELTTEHKKILSEVLTLQEALELYKPDFIFRSQKRLQELEVKAKQRRVQIQECMQPQRKRIRPLPSPFKKRQCTRPHPLSDNLYKPKERMIPEKEMQMRSKRIYNKLPEVKKKKEEEKKKVASQTNRLRAMVFKKKLLDQILQKQ